MFLKMLLSQAWHKWAVTLMVWLTMTALVTLYVYSSNSAKFNNRSMQIIMKNLGHNLLILPEKADAGETYTCGDGQMLFPESIVDEMAAHLPLKSKYYVAVLQQKHAVGESSVLLTGIRPVRREDESKEKGNLIKPVKPGSVRIGAEAARILAVDVDEEVALAGGNFRVARVLRADGSANDFRVYMNLHDAQSLLGQDGQINIIWSFMCMHGLDLPGIIAAQDRIMADVFPDYRTITAMNIAHARDIARRATSGYLANFVGLVAVITMLIIAVTGVQEVTERRRELGVMLAMGSGYPYIIALYTAKVLAVAVLASATGFIAGSFLSKGMLGGLMVVNTQQVGFVWSQFPSLLVRTCGVAVLAALAPVLKLITMDPNAILTED